MKGSRRRPSEPTSREHRDSSLDGAVLFAVAILAGFGIVMVYSTTAPLAMGRALPPHFLRHLISLLVAGTAGVIAMRFPLAAWRRLALPLWLASVTLLALTLFAGVEINGARRWLALPGLPLSFQAAEIAKLASVLAGASLLGRARARGGVSRREVHQALFVAAMPALLLLMQPDLGNAGVLLALMGLLLFAAGATPRQLAAPGAVVAIGAAAFVAMKPYAVRRLVGFLDPWQRAHDEGFQLVQSFVAFGRGGTFGVGVGDGRQKLGFLPYAHTDFILSVVAEELGLVGVLVVLGAFAALVVAGVRIAGRARERFALLAAFGMTALIALPAAVNAGVVMGLLPTTGFTLPLVSFGGTSLVICAVALGILLRIGAREAAPRPPRVAGAAPRGLWS